LPAREAFPCAETCPQRARLSGTPAAPNGDLRFTLARANLYDEPVDQLQGTVRYSNALLDIPSLVLKAPAGSLSLHGSYAHQGAVKLHVDGADIEVAKIEHTRQVMPGLAGTVHLDADVSADLRESHASATSC